MQDGTWLVIAIIVGYFVPTFIAFFKRHHQGSAIAMVNLLLGWTALGWIAALIWSLTSTDGSWFEEDDTTCPFCAETIKAAALVCRFCNRELE